MKLTSRFEIIEKLGKGTYGTVYKVKDKKLNRIVAIKKMILPNDEEGIPSTALREISILKGLNHPNIVSLLDIIIETNKIYLILEYLQTDLKIFLDSLNNKYLDLKTVKKFMYQLLAGVQEMHSKRILHRDLKPQNILIDKDYSLKIADFGLARTFSIPIRPYTNNVVTLWYRAPEVLLGGPEYSTPIDIWALGCIFFEVVTKKALIMGETETEQINRMFRILGTPTEKDWPGISAFKKYDEQTVPNLKKESLKELFSELYLDDLGIDLLERMLIYNPIERITAKSAMDHPFFYEIKNNFNF
jgi:serine/threonine protein kinase